MKNSIAGMIGPKVTPPKSAPQVKPAQVGHPGRNLGAHLHPPKKGK